MRNSITLITCFLLFSRLFGQDTLNVIFFDTSSFTYGNLLYPAEGSYILPAPPRETLKQRNSFPGFKYIDPRSLTGSNNFLMLTSYQDSIPNNYLLKIDPNQTELYNAYSENYFFDMKYNKKSEFLEKNKLFRDTLICKFTNDFGDILLERIPLFFDMNLFGTDTLRSFSSYLKVSDSMRSALQPKIYRWTEPFFMKETEVTNGEYRLFVNYVRDSIAISKLYDSLDFETGKKLLNCSKKVQRSLNADQKKEYISIYGLNFNYFNETKENDFQNAEFVPVLSNMYLPQPERYYKRREFDTEKFMYKSANGKSIPVYPDTTCWKAGKNFEKNWKALMYSWHPGFDDHPVVGLNLQQMNAYCEWYERKINHEMKDSGIHLKVRLPELRHYEMAAKLVTSIDLRNQIKVNPSEALAYQRNEWDADAQIVSCKTAMIEHPLSASEEKFTNWLQTNQTKPLLQLLGGVAEVCIIPGSQEGFMTILGGDRYLGLIDPNEVQINTLFYQRSVPSEQGSSTVGFRPVIMME